MDISAAPGGATEPQGQVVQGGGQLPSDKGVGHGQAAGKPGQASNKNIKKASACWLPDMLVVATEGLLDVEQEGKVLGLLKMVLLAGTLKQLRWQQLHLVGM